jgi:pantoate--beta-alanine ligase
MSPSVLRTVSEFRAACDALRAGGERVGLVPTMGALHRGHTSLMTAALERGAAPVVTIFVNPTQFGPSEDFARYPRDLERDLELCRAAGVRLVFAPAVTEIYPPDERTRVRVSGLTDVLCGPFRPGHFEGVATIVAKLFAAAGPCLALFGRKDYQQLQVIRRMARDLLLPVEVVGCATVRDPDGLALSSRNAYLGAEQRALATRIATALSAAHAAFASGERRAGELRLPVVRALESAGFRLDYVEGTSSSAPTSSYPSRTPAPCPSVRCSRWPLSSARPG